jgi:hypothetical protein
MAYARAQQPEGKEAKRTWKARCTNAPGRFPAARRKPACRLRGAPPRWPVSGLAEATRVSFPGSQASQWIRHERGIGQIPVRLPLRGQLRLGLWPWWTRPFLIPVELRLHECNREHQPNDHSKRASMHFAPDYGMQASARLQRRRRHVGSLAPRPSRRLR